MGVLGVLRRLLCCNNRTSVNPAVETTKGRDARTSTGASSLSSGWRDGLLDERRGAGFKTVRKRANERRLWLRTHFHIVITAIDPPSRESIDDPFIAGLLPQRHSSRPLEL